MKLRQFEFARRDYEGLSSDVADKVRQRRADYAEGLRDLRNIYRRDQGVISQMFRDPSNTNIITRGEIRRGGIKSNYKVNTSRNLGLNHHNGEILKQQINIAKDAGDLIRKEAVEEQMNRYGSMRKPEIHTVKQPKPTAKEIRDFVSAKEKETIKKASKGLLNFVKNHKKAIGGTALGATALGTGGYYLYKRNKNK